MTNLGTPKPIRGGTLTPANTTGNGCSATLNTRYEQMGMADIISLAHYPKTVVLIEYDTQRNTKEM